MNRGTRPVEFQFSLGNRWSKRLFIALLRRYDLKPYRYKRQKHTTVMVKVPKRFLDETLWPQFKQLDEVLERHLDEIAERVIEQALETTSADADAVERPQTSLPLGE